MDGKQTMSSWRSKGPLQQALLHCPQELLHSQLLPLLPRTSQAWNAVNVVTHLVCPNQHRQD